MPSLSLGLYGKRACSPPSAYWPCGIHARRACTLHHGLCLPQALPSSFAVGSVQCAPLPRFGHLHSLCLHQLAPTAVSAQRHSSNPGGAAGAQPRGDVEERRGAGARMSSTRCACSHLEQATSTSPLPWAWAAAMRAELACSPALQPHPLLLMGRHAPQGWRGVPGGAALVSVGESLVLRGAGHRGCDRSGPTGSGFRVGVDPRGPTHLGFGVG